MEWKWTKGENYERTKRIKREPLENSFSFTQQIEQTAYESSLHYDESSWELMNHTQNGFLSSNKREDTDKKWAEREMMNQVNKNPFLVENDYVKDMEIRDSFLKPVSTFTEERKNI
jgi:hypothetical protein